MSQKFFSTCLTFPGNRSDTVFNFKFSNRNLGWLEQTIITFDEYVDKIEFIAIRFEIRI